MFVKFMKLLLTQMIIYVIINLERGDTDADRLKIQNSTKFNKILL